MNNAELFSMRCIAQWMLFVVGGRCGAFDARTASTCVFHLRRLRQLSRFADQSTMQRLVSAFVIARLDYCNSVMAGLPASSLAPLNRVLSAAVRLVAGLGPRDHITEHMKRLHWLPIVSD